MQPVLRWGCVLIAVILAYGHIAACIDHPQRSTTRSGSLSYHPAQRIGRLASDRLVECSGIEPSTTDEDLIWAINDGGNAPHVHALGADGRNRGYFRITGAENRDWEGMDIFDWHGRSMILIADVGDNHRRYDTLHLYIVEAPRLHDERLPSSTAVTIAWRVDFAYPDGPHDAEGIAVDAAAGEVLIITKRDRPPLLFAVPLRPPSSGQRVTARRLSAVNRIPPPTPEDRRHPYGSVRSQPTALDLSADGRTMIVLTYKHAYRFDRHGDETWSSSVQRRPTLVRLPLPQHVPDLRQREAICFSRGDRSLLVTSEGRHAGLFRLTPR